ncbi:MAG: glycosyltransferase [Rhodanobacteraceae bacterium]|nr:glycosyltransferase [Rhodanobacteraceae bacterium]
MAFRTDHGLGNAPCVAFLGSWYPTKRPERIIAIGEAIRREQPDAHIVVLGGGDGLALLRQHEAPWLHVLGPRHGREKFVALAACRCLAVTGIAGLNVLDAMAVARPVVLSRRGGHSQERDLRAPWRERPMGRGQRGCLGRRMSSSDQSLPLATRLDEAAGQSAGRLTPQSVAATWLTGARHLAQHDEATSARHVVLVYQRMLAYHCARFTALAAELAREGIRCTALEVANTDSSYGDAISVASTQRGGIVSLFPNCDYLSLRPRQVASAVCMALQALRADVVFAPAPAFAEGAGALHHKVRFGGRLLQMDDAWAATDQSGVLVRWVKRSFNGFVDGGFLPDALHGQHFVGLNIPLDRQAYAVDVVGPATGIAEPLVAQPDRRFVLFVGRLIERKGLHTLLNALAQWPASEQRPALVVIGDGPPSRRCKHRLLGSVCSRTYIGWECGTMPSTGLDAPCTRAGGAQRLRAVGFGGQRGVAK